MSAISFRPAFVVTAEEDGSGKPLGALAFAPTEATRRRLADHRLTFRPRAGGFVLYAQFNVEAGDARRAPIADRVSLVFGIRSAEPNLLRRYHPDLDPQTGPNLYLTNAVDAATSRPDGTLAQGATVEAVDAARIVPRRLIARADLTAAPPPTHLALADRLDATRSFPDIRIDAPAQSSSAAVAVDLSADPASSFTLAPKPPGTPKTTLFVDDELAGRGAFGVLELVARPRPGPEPVSGRVHFARFRRRS